MANTTNIITITNTANSNSEKRLDLFSETGNIVSYTATNQNKQLQDTNTNHQNYESDNKQLSIRTITRKRNYDQSACKDTNNEEVFTKWPRVDCSHNNIKSQHEEHWQNTIVSANHNPHVNRLIDTKDKEKGILDILKSKLVSKTSENELTAHDLIPLTYSQMGCKINEGFEALNLKEFQSALSIVFDVLSRPTNMENGFDGKYNRLFILLIKGLNQCGYYKELLEVTQLVRAKSDYAHHVQFYIAYALQNTGKHSEALTMIETIFQESCSLIGCPDNLSSGTTLLYRVVKHGCYYSKLLYIKKNYKNCLNVINWMSYFITPNLGSTRSHKAHTVKGEDTKPYAEAVQLKCEHLLHCCQHKTALEYLKAYPYALSRELIEVQARAHVADCNYEEALKCHQYIFFTTDNNELYRLKDSAFKYNWCLHTLGEITGNDNYYKKAILLLKTLRPFFQSYSEESCCGDDEIENKIHDLQKYFLTKTNIQSITWSALIKADFE